MITPLGRLKEDKFNTWNEGYDVLTVSVILDVGAKFSLFTTLFNPSLLDCYLCNWARLYWVGPETYQNTCPVA